MNIRHIFLLITLSILMVSTNAKSDECTEGDNYLLPAGESYTLYNDIHQSYNDEVDVCVTHENGEPVRVEDGDGNELFSLLSGMACSQFQGIDKVKATCLGVDDGDNRNGYNNCSISWSICGTSPEFAIPDPPIPSPTRIGDKVIEVDEDVEYGVAVGIVLSPEGTDSSGWTKNPSRLDCPEGTILSSYEVPVYDPVEFWNIIGWETYWYCHDENAVLPK